MRQSNGYIVLFTVVLTVICAGALAGAFEGLKGLHKNNVALDKKKQILSAVMDLEGMKGEEVSAKYKATISAVSVDPQGEVLPDVDAEKINTVKVFKEKDPSKKVFPVFIYANGDEVAYILPMEGNGLWDAVSGYIAMDSDLNTIKGVSFAHKGETPGLGARITDKPVRNRFVGKQIFDVDGTTLMGVAFQKGEKIDYSNEPHKVDGLAGASMTTEGVNAMLLSYFKSYEPYFIKVKGESTTSRKEEVKLVEEPAPMLSLIHI